MRKIKIAQIGTNKFSHGNEIFQTLKKLPDIFEIAGYALPENEKEKFPERLSVFEGYPDLTLSQILNDPEIEAVAVETEEINLTKYAVPAAQHKKHIHMEKPGGTQLSEFEKLIDTVKANNIVFQPGYMYRYNPAVLYMHDLINDGRIGEITAIDAQMSTQHDMRVNKLLSGFKGGNMFWLGCHLFDLVYSVAGVPDEIIPMHNKSGFIMDGVLDNTFAVLKYPKFVATVRINSTEVNGYRSKTHTATAEARAAVGDSFVVDYVRVCDIV